MSERCTNLIGQRFDRWIVLSSVETEQGQTSRWLCRCDCGNYRIVREKSLIAGGSRSCGCLTRESNRTHGMSDTRPYRIWQSMKTRCTNSKQPNYERYGARGISYTPDWETFQRFWADMSDGYADDLTLDRIDNNKPYTKDNCRWVTPAQQNRNSRSAVMIAYNGERLCLTDWAQKLNIPRKRLYYLRYKKGLTGPNLLRAAIGT